jgi:DNA-binding response OmpR family regulator
MDSSVIAVVGAATVVTGVSPGSSSSPPHAASDPAAMRAMMGAARRRFTGELLGGVGTGGCPSTMVGGGSCEVRSGCETFAKLPVMPSRAPPAVRNVGGVAPTRVLVVDDEPTVREVVATYLTRDGFVVSAIGDGDEVLAEVGAFRPDLIVLDVMLPSVDGITLLREIRSTSAVPVIMLTARVEEPDRVLGLELGADDYVTKPFSPRELSARVRSVLRRGEHRTDTAPARLTFDGLVIDTAAREVTIDGTVVGLTPKEFDLLAFLAASPRHVFSRAQLLANVWDSAPEFQDPATVTVHVRRIRQKIESDPDDPRWITTVFGVGYRFGS